MVLRAGGWGPKGAGFPGRAPSQASGLTRGSLRRWGGVGSQGWSALGLALPGAGDLVGAVALTPPVHKSPAHHPNQGWEGSHVSQFPGGNPSLAGA